MQQITCETGSLCLFFFPFQMQNEKSSLECMLEGDPLPLCTWALSEREKRRQASQGRLCSKWERSVGMQLLSLQAMTALLVSLRPSLQN